MNASFPPPVFTASPTDVVEPDFHVGTVIVGGGPAGIAPLIAAVRDNALADLLAGGLAIVERGPAIGAGRIGSYAISSDSTADTLLNCVLESRHPLILRLCDHPAVIAVRAFGRGAVPLPLIGTLMGVVGGVLRTILKEADASKVLSDHDAIEVRRTRQGLWDTRIRALADGQIRTIRSGVVVLATGGHQPPEELERQIVGGVPLLPRYQGKLVQSDAALTAEGLAMIGDRLAASHGKRVAIVGSSSSAVACANALLQSRFGRDLAEGAVTILHRRPLRVFYPSAAVALAEGYDEFGPDDICPVSGFVFRFAGFRLDSRELVMAARGIGGRRPEPRLRLHRLLHDSDQAAQGILDDADVVVAALGYRPRGLPVVSAGGQPISLYCDGSGSRPLVDDKCRVLNADGEPITGLLGIGLAAGFQSRDAIGGEATFSGQTNGLWQWQNDIGTLIVRAVRETIRAGGHA